MATYDCDDFRVSFDGAGDGSYHVTARSVDGRAIDSTFRLPMAVQSLEAAVLQLGKTRSREVAPELVTAQKANAEQLGGVLGHALFDDAIGSFYDEARRSAAKIGHGVRLTLSLASTPELLSVPWELLYRRPSFLASQRRTPVVRYLDVGDPPPPASIEGPVRVLGVVASPAGLPELNVADERSRVEKALASMVGRGLVELDWCDPATPRSLRERLRDGSYHVLHYVGHSDFTDDGQGMLFLDDEFGGAAQVSEAVLTNLLGDQTSLRLAILNSCDGARTTLTDPFAGIATSLVALGVPAVVAMQFTISDRAAIVFAEELFTSLIGRQYPIDAAVSEARKAVFTEVNEIEWATPVLFLRPADGQLFNFTAAPAALPLPAAPAPLDADHVEAPLDPASQPISRPAPAVSDAPTVPRVPLVPLDPPSVGLPKVPPPPATAGPAPVAAAPVAALITDLHPFATPQVVRVPGRHRRARWLLLVAVIAAAVGVGVLIERDHQDSSASPTDTGAADTSGDQANAEDPHIDIPAQWAVGTSFDVSGTICPDVPDGWTDIGVAIWLDADGSTIADDSFGYPDGPWSGSIDIPGDASLDASYDVGASCFGTDANGEANNFFEYPTEPLEVVAG